MSTYLWLLIAWGLVTITLVALLIYRSRLEDQETDWIPLTDDDREDQAIRAQSMIELKTQRLTMPIRALGALSVVLILAIVGLWLYQGIMTPPPPPQ